MKKYCFLVLAGLFWGLLPFLDSISAAGGGDGTYIPCAISYGFAFPFLFAAGIFSLILLPTIYVLYSFLLWFYPKYSICVLLLDILGIGTMLWWMGHADLFDSWAFQWENWERYFSHAGVWGVSGIVAAKLLLILVVSFNDTGRRGKPC